MSGRTSGGMTPPPTYPICVQAYELIGLEGEYRLVWGRTVYEAAFSVDGGGDRVRLARLENTPDGLRQINRYINGSTPIEVLSYGDQS